MKLETIELITQYKDGKEIKQFISQVFAEKKSVTRNEFYSAYGVGLRPQLLFSMYAREYKLADVVVGNKTYHATHIKYHGETYEIVRTYEVDRFNMEVTVK